MSDPLVERLLAAIDAKTQRAEAALGSVWTVAEWEKTMVVSNGPHMDGWITYGGNDGFDGGVANAATAAFIVDNDPQTVLRRCAADRRMVEKYLREVKTLDDLTNWRTKGTPRPDAEVIRAGLILVWARLDALRDLADGYGITDTEEAR